MTDYCGFVRISMNSISFLRFHYSPWKVEYIDMSFSHLIDFCLEKESLLKEKKARFTARPTWSTCLQLWVCLPTPCGSWYRRGRLDQ